MLKVSGKNFHIAGITMYGGRVVGGRNGGGNLEIVANGDHIIEDSFFVYQVDGLSSYLGNVFVQTNSSLTVRRSNFTSGDTVDFSAGNAGRLVVWDAEHLDIEYSKFFGNVGGLMTHWEYPRYMEPGASQHISIYGSSFQGNSYAGYMATNIGSLPSFNSLQIAQTSFIDNQKGVEICCADEDNLEVVLCGNEGTDGEDPCDSMSIFYDDSVGGGGWQCDDCCFRFDENYPFQVDASPAPSINEKVDTFDPTASPISPFCSTTISEISSLNQVKLLSNDEDVVNDEFGRSVAIYEDIVVIGSPYDSDNGLSRRGSAYVFQKNSFDNCWSLAAKLIADDGEPNDQFGVSVAIYKDTVVVGSLASIYSDYVVVGGVQPKGTYIIGTGATYIFVRDLSNNKWIQQAKLLPSEADEPKCCTNKYPLYKYFGRSVAIYDNTIVVSEGYATYVFANDGSNNWSQEAKLSARERSIALHENSIVVGRVIYVKDASGNWSEQDYLMPDGPSASRRFGASVAIYGDTVVVGASEDKENGNNSGSAFVFKRDVSNIWKQQAKLLPTDGASYMYFGNSITIYEDIVIVGAYGNKDPNGQWVEQCISLQEIQMGTGHSKLNFYQMMEQLKIDLASVLVSIMALLLLVRIGTMIMDTVVVQHISFLSLNKLYPRHCPQLEVQDHNYHN